MFPISDDNPHSAFPVFTLLFIGGCIAAFVWQVSLPPEALQQAIISFGAVPAVIFGTTEPAYPALAPAPWLTLFTSMFLHGGLLHLGGNMLFLWIFGDNVEWAVGRLKFVVFYFLCGAAAALTQAYVDPSSQIPLIGASGAIAGVLGAYLVLFPFAEVRTLIFLILIVQMVHIPAVIVLGVWFAVQIFSGVMSSAEAGIAFWAHVGGFVAGIVLIPFFKRREARFFTPPRHAPFSRA
ncbi:MAG: rhomboid family intramembrane serine protease [Pseudomonadota bacterium]